MDSPVEEYCAVCRNLFKLKSLRLIRHVYGKRRVYAYICLVCAENVARARTKEEEAK